MLWFLEYYYQTGVCVPSLNLPMFLWIADDGQLEKRRVLNQEEDFFIFKL